MVPRIHDALTHVWNPQSRTSNARALAAVQEALVYTDAFAAHMKELFAGVLGSLQNCVKGIAPLYLVARQGFKSCLTLYFFVYFYFYLVLSELYFLFSFM